MAKAHAVDAEAVVQGEMMLLLRHESFGIDIFSYVCVVAVVTVLFLDLLFAYMVLTFFHARLDS